LTFKLLFFILLFKKMVKEFNRGGSRGAPRGGRGGDRGGRGGGRGGFRGGMRQNFDMGPPAQVIEVGTVMHPCEEYIVMKNILADKVPIFNRPVYLENKTKIGVIDDVFGPINEFMFSVKCDEGVKPTSFKRAQNVILS
jgi:H/ACA ribonucleoprotein complex subunit 1